MASSETNPKSPVKELSHESIGPQSCYQIKPGLKNVFKGEDVREVLRTVLSYTLSDKNYDSEKVNTWTVKMCNDINEKVKDLVMKRYKHVVQVNIGEKKGQGVKCGFKCVWDSEWDNYVSEIFMNDTLFCVATVYAVFLY